MNAELGTPRTAALRDPEAVGCGKQQAHLGSRSRDTPGPALIPSCSPQHFTPSRSTESTCRPWWLQATTPLPHGAPHCRSYSLSKPLVLPPPQDLPPPPPTLCLQPEPGPSRWAPAPAHRCTLPQLGLSLQAHTEGPSLRSSLQASPALRGCSLESSSRERPVFLKTSTRHGPWAPQEGLMAVTYRCPLPAASVRSCGDAHSPTITTVLPLTTEFDFKSFSNMGAHPNPQSHQQRDPLGSIHCPLKPRGSIHGALPTAL